ncbi:hypothetical protein EV356DRAFT_497988 [Viridothelium virens]|uniref:Uncharacterized protein n=1 Tax=Viridothelium virens TaxID=1048519 RepID=A0A6A6GSJ0_VIRVR|nr:hypothetical protein EV356DRAFT_497988 [Viridothelium virens]
MSRPQSKQSRFFNPKCALPEESMRDDGSLLNAHSIGLTEEEKENGRVCYPSLPPPVDQDFPTPLVCTAHTSQWKVTTSPKVTTPPNIGRRREPLAALIASPSRPGHSVKISKIFEDAHLNIVNTLRKGLRFQCSPSPKLLTSTSRQPLRGRYQPPKFLHGDALKNRTGEYERTIHQPPPFFTLNNPRVKLDFSQENSRTSQLVTGHPEITMMRGPTLPFIFTCKPGQHTAQIDETMTKGNPGDDSPQLPALQPFSDLLSHFGDLLGPARPDTPPYDIPIEHVLTLSPPAAAAKETAPYSPSSVGSWTDDEIFYPGYKKKQSKQVLQPTLSQSGGNDSESHSGSSSCAPQESEPIATKASEESVLTWLNKVNPGAGDHLLGSQHAKERNNTQHSAYSSASMIDSNETAVEEDAPSERSSANLPSVYATPPRRAHRSDSTCSSPPRVSSDTKTPPFSPLSPDVMIERGKHHHARTKTSSYYDEDILKVQEELRREERRQARLRPYECPEE